MTFADGLSQSSVDNLSARRSVPYAVVSTAAVGFFLLLGFVAYSFSPSMVRSSAPTVPSSDKAVILVDFGSEDVIVHPYGENFESDSPPNSEKSSFGSRQTAHFGKKQDPSSVIETVDGVPDTSKPKTDKPALLPAPMSPLSTVNPAAVAQLTGTDKQLVRSLDVDVFINSWKVKQGCISESFVSTLHV